MVSVDGHDRDHEVRGRAEHGGQRGQDVDVHVDGVLIHHAFVHFDV